MELGSKARDTISGFEGIVVAKTEWLNGCVRYTLEPTKLKDDGSTLDDETFDVQQLEAIEEAKPKEKASTGGPPHHHATRAPDPR